MPLLSPTVHRTIIFVDVADFTNPSRNVADLMAVQDGVYEVLETAFTDCGVDFDSCAKEDRGDGALIMIPPEISKSRLADLLPDRLVAALRRYNATHASTAQFKLRVGIHAGDIRQNDKGWIGHAVNLTARILEANEVKSALARSDGLVALVASDHFYTEVIEQDPGVAPEQYRPIDVSVKKFSGTAWLRIPGETAPRVPAGPPEPSDPPTASEPNVLAEIGLEVIPSDALDTLQGWLADVEVPHLATLVTRAVGSAISPPRHTSAWGVFRYLSDFNAGPDGVPPALAYLKLLASEVGGEIQASVSAWVDQQSQRLRRTTVLEELHASLQPIPEEPHLYLTIIVEPDAIDPQRCVLSYWRQDDPLVWPPTRGDVHEVTRDELEYRVDEIILATEQVWSDQVLPATIEFVLARSMLTLPVHQWCKEHQSGDPRPLAFDYQLRVRSLERMRTTYWHRSWKTRWRSVVDHPGLDRIHPFGPMRAGERIDAVLSDPRWVGLVMERPPSPQPQQGADPDVLTAALRAGLPLICWHPTAGPEDLRKQVDWLLRGEGGFIDVPGRRQVALLSGSKNDLVYDLVLMWEDPNRVISFAQPYTTNPQ